MSAAGRGTGPLADVRVVELGGVGPAPFCGMLLADLGGDVLRVDRPGQVELGLAVAPRADLINRGKRRVALDLKAPGGLDAAMRLVAAADVLIEGFRPGVTERLGLGPEECLALNPRLVYGRMTGWGRSGPLAAAAGHDINYIALTGLLHSIGPRDGGPLPPLNVAGDFGGGALFLALGVVAALHERERSGEGQVVDAAIVDGAASLMTPVFGHAAEGGWRDERGANVLDGSAPWYAAYETADGRFVCIGALEDRFYADLLSLLGLDPATLPDRSDRDAWPSLRARFAELFRTRTRAEWCEILEGTDACFAPVLSLAEAPEHAHNRARATFVEVGGIVQPAPAPRFGRSRPGVPRGPEEPGPKAPHALRAWGFTEREIRDLQGSGTLA